MNQERLNTLARRFANLLHDMDPVGTTCLLNLDMEDEYDDLGLRVAERFCNDQPLGDALMAVFDQAFWPGCLTESHRRWSLQRPVDELQREASDPLQRPPLAYNHSQIYE